MSFVSLLMASMTIVSVSPMIVNFSSSGEITLKAFSYYKSNDGSGYSWIAIINDSNDGYNIGPYYMEAGETVTVGLWGNLDHAGVWYNIESHVIDSLGFFDGRVSVSKSITREQMGTVNSYVSSHDYWNISYNCSVFVKDIWNLVSDDKLNCGWMVNLPAWLCDSIKGKSEYETNETIATNDKIGYAENNTFTQYVPDNFGGSSSSSSAVNPSLMATSFPQRDIDELMNMSMSMGYSFDR